MLNKVIGLIVAGLVLVGCASTLDGLGVYHPEDRVSVPPVAYDFVPKQVPNIVKVSYWDVNKACHGTIDKAPQVNRAGIAIDISGSGRVIECASKQATGFTCIVPEADLSGTGVTQAEQDQLIRHCYGHINKFNAGVANWQSDEGYRLVGRQ